MSRGKKQLIGNKLANSLEELTTYLGALEDEQWQEIVYSEGSEWTAADLLRHLADSARGMTRLMERIREGGEGVPPDFDLGRWNARGVEKAKEKSPEQLLAELKEQRPSLLQFVGALDEGDWHKQGRHASLRILSIEEICHLIADHELSHLNDIRRVLGE